MATTATAATAAEAILKDDNNNSSVAATTSMMIDEIDTAIKTTAIVSEQQEREPHVIFIAKYGKERIVLQNQVDEDDDNDYDDDEDEDEGTIHIHLHTTIEQIKYMIQAKTNILPIRQKFIGLKVSKTTATTNGNGGKGSSIVHDQLQLKDLIGKTTIDPKNVKQSIITYECILMGTPEERIFIDPKDMEQNVLPDIIDDFDLEYNVGSKEWTQHYYNEQNMKSFTNSTIIHVMNEPRDNKPLLVLDLDHTLLDFSSKTLQQEANIDLIHSLSNPTTPITTSAANKMKRPYMDEFLSNVYQYYDLVVWSQTSWRWLETKLIELGMINHPNYKFCFVLDKTSMFTVVSTKRDGTKVQHHVKPLQIIWSKFPDRWGTHNTVHIDDLSRNFALNIDNGLQCTAYYRKKKKSSSSSSSSNIATGQRDVELIGLSKYLTQLAESGIQFHNVDFTQWTDVVSGKIASITEKIVKKKK